MGGKSGKQIQERIREVFEEGVRTLARERTAPELLSHWSGFGQLLDSESNSGLARLGMEFVGFLPGR